MNFLVNIIIGIFYSIHCFRFSFSTLTQKWTYRLTKSTIYAFCFIYPRIKKTLCIFSQRNTFLGANLHTSGTSATERFIDNIDHYMKRALRVKTFFTIKFLSPVVHPKSRIITLELNIDVAPTTIRRNQP